MWEALGEYAGPPIFKLLVRYTAARLIRSTTEDSYRRYVTESLRLIPQDMYFTRGWGERASRRASRERTAEEIVDGVAERMEAMFGEPT